jgi:hypothetical protein
MNMNVRIGNIECRQTIYKEREYEIIKWWVNDYYGNEEKMIKEDGYVKEEYDNGDWGLRKDFHHINSSCFKNPETCYVIAWLKPNRKEPDVSMETVGNRILELDQKELSTFMRVYRIAHELVMEEITEDESE